MTIEHIVEIKESDGADTVFIELPKTIVNHLNLRAGDKLVCKSKDDGSIALARSSDTELVLVETIQQFRIRYAVEVPKGCKDWALEAVTMQEADEFSSKDLGETIVTSRVICPAELQQLCYEDNANVQNIDIAKVVTRIV